MELPRDIGILIEKLKKTKSNPEFLLSINQEK